MKFVESFLILSQWQTIVTLGFLFVIFFVIYKMYKNNISFSIRMLFALFVGLALGFVLQYLAGYPDVKSAKEIIWFNEVKTWFSFVSTAFIGFIKMLVIPIISVSIIKVVMNLSKDIKVASLLLYSLFWILFTTAIAACVGLLLGWYFELGSGFDIQIGNREAKDVLSITDILLGLIPSNIAQAMTSENIIAIVIFSFFVGFGARSLQKQNDRISYKVFEKFIFALHGIIMNITSFVISFMPYAILCMMANVVISNGFEAIKIALLFIVLIYVAMIIMFIIHCVLLGVNGLNPFVYIKKSFSVLLFAFSSRSSVGTLPLTISTLQNKLGVSSSVSNFVASIGTTVGLNGCAGYFPALSAVFIAYCVGIDIDLTFVVMVVLIAILGSLGIAGVPGSATMAASIMLTGIGFGEYFVYLTLILAVDPIVDMARTASNVSGAMTSAILTDKNLNTLNKDTYNS